LQDNVELFFFLQEPSGNSAKAHFVHVCLALWDY